MWVLEQIRVSVEKNSLAFPAPEYSFRIADMFGEKTDPEKRKKISLCPNIITPNTIPEFCIPPKMTSLQELKTVDWSKHVPVVKASSETDGPEQEAPARERMNTHIIQVENVDEASYDGFSDEDSTNADPQSQAALSLPHLAKTQTSYGFCTLLESPHTRRKESLFHNDPNSCGIPLVSTRGRSSTYSRCTHTASYSLNKMTSRLSPRVVALHRQSTLDSDTTSSTDSSPFSSPLLARPLPKSCLLKALSHEKLLSRAAKKVVLSRNNSLSTDECSSTDNSPNIGRRASEGLVEPLPNTFSLAPPAILPMDLVMYRERVLKECLIPVGREGTLRLSAEYCSDNQRLRVRLISAEGLYNMSVDPKSINCNISVCLLPGKVQKQRSTVIKKSRNPIFNEDFFFDGICAREINIRSLRFKVVNKMSTMKRDYILGDCEILLNSVLSKSI